MGYPEEFACHFMGVGGVVIHEDKVLLVKLTYGPAKGMWLIPGGLVDRGETLQEAVKREILEETGVKVQPRGIVGIRSMVRAEDQLTDLYCIFMCDVEMSPEELAKDDPEIAEIGRQFGAEVPFLRDGAADDQATASEASILALRQAEEYWNETYDLVAQLLASCPLRTEYDVDALQLQEDLIELIQTLETYGLVQIESGH